MYIKTMGCELPGQVLAAQLQAGPVRLDAGHEDGGFSGQRSRFSVQRSPLKKRVLHSAFSVPGSPFRG